MMEENFSKQLLSQFKKDPGRHILHILVNGEYVHITYKELLSRAKDYQFALNQAGIASNDVVILILIHGLDLVYAYFGTILNGSIPSIMPYLTEKLFPDKYKQDLKSLIGITKPSAVITFQDFIRETGIFEKDDSSIKAVVITEKVSHSPISEEEVDDFPGISQHPEQIALLQHSSGTTGLQKGVALSHRAIFNQLESYQNALVMRDGDVIVSWLPLYHDMGLIAGFLMPLLSSIPLVLMSPFDWVRAPYRLMQAINDFKGTLCWLPNFAYNFCAKKIRSRDLEGIDLSSLRAVINCSEPMRFKSHEMFFEHFKDYGFKAEALATSYAMAENVFAVTQGGIERPISYDEIDLISFQEKSMALPADGTGKVIKMVSAGKPISNVDVKIVDKDGVPLSDRYIGEIIISSDCMLTEYYNRKDATEETFIDGWFKTGDLGYIADEELYISGRKKDLIIVGGKNIYPKDIETIAMEIKGVHPGRVVAFGIYNDLKGTEDVVVIAEIEEDYLDQKENISDLIRKQVTIKTAIALRKVLAVDKKWLIKTSSGKIARALNKAKYLREIQGGNVL